MNVSEFMDHDKDIRYFRHQFTDGGATTGFLGFVRQLPDGNCLMAQFNSHGVIMPLIKVWSGCLMPDKPMPEDHQKALLEVRKGAEMAATEALEAQPA